MTRYKRTKRPIERQYSGPKSEQLRAALEHFEWTSDARPFASICRWCRGHEPAHKPNCGRQVALAAINEALNGPREPDTT